MRTLFLLLAAVCFSWSASPAATVVFYNDDSANYSSVEALKAEIQSAHTLYSADSIDAFENLLETHPEIDVAILSLQEGEHTVSEFPRFAQFIDEGGRVIFTDAYRNASWESFLKFSYSGNVNLTSIRFIDTYLSALVGENVQTLLNPGYHVFSMGMNVQEKTLALFENGDAASLFIDNHIIVNGFLLDTDSGPEASPQLTGFAAARATARATTGTILLAQIDYLLNPPLTANATHVDVPLERSAFILLALLLLGASMVSIYAGKSGDGYGR